MVRPFAVPGRARAAMALAVAWCAPLAAAAAQELAPDALFARVAGSVYIVLAADHGDLKTLMGNPIVPPPEPEAEGAAMPTARERALRESGRGNRPPMALGSAVALAPEIAVTNCHVVANRPFVAVVEGNSGAPAEIVDARPNDICLLRVRGMTLKPVAALRPSVELKVGERVYAIGNPRGLERSLSEGLLSGVRMRAGVRIVQSTAPISPGSSGGALFDAQGRLIGITTFKSRSDPELNFAVAVEEFWPLAPAVLAAGPAPPPAAAPPPVPGPVRLHDDLLTRCGPIQVRGIAFVTTALKCVEGQQRRVASATVETTRLAGTFRGGTLEVDHARIVGGGAWGPVSADQLKAAVQTWAKAASPSDLSAFEANPFPHYKLAVRIRGAALACARGHARPGVRHDVTVWITYCEPAFGPHFAANLAAVFGALRFE